MTVPRTECACLLGNYLLNESCKNNTIKLCIILFGVEVILNNHHTYRMISEGLPIVFVNLVSLVFMPFMTGMKFMAVFLIPMVSRVFDCCTVL